MTLRSPGLLVMGLSCLVLVMPTHKVLASGQEHEILWLDGVRVSTQSEPLASWLESHPDALPPVQVRSSGRWRGYVGEWEVSDDRLFLVDLLMLSGHSFDETGEVEDVSVFDSVFGESGPVGADWYTGFVIVPNDWLDKTIVIEVQAGYVTEVRRLGKRRFRRFATRQFESWKGTADYEAELSRCMEQGLTREEAEKGLFSGGWASPAWLSMWFGGEPGGENSEGSP